MKKQTGTYILYGVISMPPADCLARDVCECMWVWMCVQCIRTPIPVMCVACVWYGSDSYVMFSAVGLVGSAREAVQDSCDW